MEQERRIIEKSIKPGVTLRAECVRAEDLSDAQIQCLMDFGKEEAAILDEMEAAVRAGDRDRVWQLAEKIVNCEDQAQLIAGAGNE